MIVCSRNQKLLLIHRTEPPVGKEGNLEIEIITRFAVEEP
jgi:hypothetical protein